MIPCPEELIAAYDAYAAYAAAYAAAYDAYDAYAAYAAYAAAYAAYAAYAANAANANAAAYAANARDDALLSLLKDAQEECERLTGHVPPTCDVKRLTRLGELVGTVSR